MAASQVQYDKIKNQTRIELPKIRKQWESMSNDERSRYESMFSILEQIIAAVKSSDTNSVSQLCNNMKETLLNYNADALTQELTKSMNKFLDLARLDESQCKTIFSEWQNSCGSELRWILNEEGEIRQKLSETYKIIVDANNPPERYRQAYTQLQQLLRQAEASNLEGVKIDIEILMAVCMQNGIGVPKNRAKAKAVYKRYQDRSDLARDLLRDMEKEDQNARQQPVQPTPSPTQNRPVSRPQNQNTNTQQRQNNNYSPTKPPKKDDGGCWSAILGWLIIGAVVFGVFKWCGGCSGGKKSKTYEYTVITDNVVLRSEGSSSGDPLATLYSGTNITSESDKDLNGEWLYVNDENGTSGYIKSYYLVPTSDWNLLQSAMASVPNDYVDKAKHRLAVIDAIKSLGMQHVEVVGKGKVCELNNGSEYYDEYAFVLKGDTDSTYMSYYGYIYGYRNDGLPVQLYMTSAPDKCKGVRSATYKKGNYKLTFK